MPEESGKKGHKIFQVSFEMFSGAEVDTERTKRLIAMALVPAIKKLGLHESDLSYKILARAVAESGQKLPGIMLREGQTIPLDEVPDAMKGCQELYRLLVRQHAEYMVTWDDIEKGPPMGKDGDGRVAHLARKSEMNNLPIHGGPDLMKLQKKIDTEGLVCLCGERMWSPFGYVPVLNSQIEDDAPICPTCMVILMEDELI